MKRYVVEQTTSGYVLGTYQADSPEHAIRVMLEDAGDNSDVSDVSEPDDGLVATEIAEGQPDIEPDTAYTVRYGLAYLDGLVQTSGGKWVDYTMAEAYMDDGLREEIHADLAPCTEQVFFDEYAKRHLNRFGRQFVGDQDNPVW